MSLIRGVVVSTSSGGSSNLANRIIVTQASDFSGVLDSTKEYFIDGVVDMGTQSIEVPAGGLTINGYNFEISRLFSTENNYKMFTSPVGGSGNVIGSDYDIVVSGLNSQVYDLTAATGFEAFEFSRVNYSNCSSLGEINGYRQGLEAGTGRFGGMPELTLSGTWLGGYFIETSIVRSLSDGAYSLFKAGIGFTMSSRFRSNQNIDLPASASFFDFSPVNFVNPSTVQIESAIVTREGSFNAADTNISPNMKAGDLVSSWNENNGMPNTFEGGSVGVSVEQTTIISTQGVFETVLASSWTTLDLQHFDSPADGQLRHLGNTPREYKFVADFIIDGNQNSEMALKVVKYDSSLDTEVDILQQVRQVNNFVGGRDVAFFNININLELDQNDYVYLKVANNTGSQNVTAEADSYFLVEER